MLFISIHGATQIFKPPVSVVGSDDRLYKYRRWIYAFILLVPQLFAALPWVGSEPKGAGYLSQGAFCTLPIRPIWYRLALAWVPRILIWFTILGLAIAIYTHVHHEFKNFSEAFQHHSTTSTSFLSDTLDGVDESPTGTEKRRNSTPNISPHRPSFDPVDQPTENMTPPIELVVRPPSIQTRRISGVGFVDESVPLQVFESSPVAVPAPVAPEGRRNSRVRIEIPTGITSPDTEIEANNDVSGKRKSISDSLRSWRSSLNQNPDDRRTSFPSSLSPDSAPTHRNSIMSLAAFFNTSRRSSDMTSHSRSRSRTWSSSTRRASQKLPRRDSVNPMNQPLAQKRAHIRRQLRQVFVYPLVYIVMWLVPFVALCVTYNDRYASRPPFLLNTFSNFCLCFIGAVNAIAFSFREKPWRHIPQNYNRSFWGSFCFWRRLDEDDEDYRSHRRRHSSINSKRWSESTYVDSTAPTTTKTQRDDPAPLAPAPPPPAALLSRSSTAPPPNTVNAVAADDVDSIQPISPRCNDPVSPTYPPALHPRTSYAPPFASRQDRGSASTARHPSASSPSASIGALARRSVASSLKRATAMAEAAAVGVRETDGQRAARELAYERLAWEREETARAGRTGSGVTMDAGEARRGSTGEIGVGKEWWERRRGSVWMGEGGEGGEQERRL